MTSTTENKDIFERLIDLGVGGEDWLMWQEYHPGGTLEEFEKDLIENKQEKKAKGEIK